MRVKSLHVYPVKGCQAVTLEKSAVNAQGLAQDRLWMPVDADGKSLLQWAHPKLARVGVRLTPAGIALSSPGLQDIHIDTPDADSPLLAVRIKKREMQAYEAAPAAHEWFSSILGAPCRLVYGGELAAGGNPVHITTTASLAALEQRMGQAVPMDRFRPNIVVDNDEPWVEDEWRHLNIGGVDFDISKPCARCEVIATDQATGERATTDKNPLAVLKTFRMIRTPEQTGVIFGQYARPRGAGILRTGDAVGITARAAA